MRFKKKVKGKAKKKNGWERTLKCIRTIGRILRGILFFAMTAIITLDRIAHKLHITRDNFWGNRNW